MKVHRVRRVLIVSALYVVPAGAQDYPVKPVRIIVPFSAGASTDLTARIIAQRLSESLKQQFVVENRAAGAGGTVGTGFVARSTADGYTLMMANNSVLNVAPHLYIKVPYDAVNDFAPIALVAWAPVVLAVHPSLPVTTVKELIALARGRPGQLSYSSSGTGSSLHLAGELFRSMGNISINHIPYKGAAPAMVDVVSGQVQLIFPAVATALPYIGQGRVRPLAVTTQKRFPLLSEVPTMAEAGLPKYVLLNWLGLVAPAHAPIDIVRTLNAEIVKWAGQTENQQKLLAMGLEAGGGTPADFGKIILSGYRMTGDIVKTAGIKAQ
jgi:tripartite-type tricarboxylate transporter receptor subunit TctC